MGVSYRDNYSGGSGGGGSLTPGDQAKVDNLPDNTSAQIVALSAKDVAIGTQIAALSAQDVIIGTQVVALSAQVVSLSAADVILNTRTVALSAQTVALSAQTAVLGTQVAALSANDVTIAAQIATLQGTDVDVAIALQTVSAQIVALSAATSGVAHIGSNKIQQNYNFGGVTLSNTTNLEYGTVSRMVANLKDASRIRVGHNLGGAIGTSGQTLKVQYTVDASLGATSLWDNISGAQLLCNLGTTQGFIGAWASVPATAQVSGGTWIRLYVSGGSNSSCVFRNAAVYVETLGMDGADGANGAAGANGVNYGAQGVTTLASGRDLKESDINQLYHVAAGQQMVITASLINAMVQGIDVVELYAYANTITVSANGGVILRSVLGAGTPRTVMQYGRAAIFKAAASVAVIQGPIT